VSTRCPGCFQLLPEDGYLWICKSGRCPTQPDDVAGRYAGQDVENGTLVYRLRPTNAGKNWAPDIPTGCPECKQAAIQEACVRCHQGLLPGWRDGQATCVAMNGSRATGKSLYIAVLVKQLDQLMAKMNSTVEFADARTRENYTEIYEKPLYESRGLMPPTPSAITDSSYQREPLIFSLGILNGVRRFLVIRDVAGEDMERPPADTTPLQFLANADAVFFMFDPMAVPEIRAKLQDDSHPASARRDPHAVLGNLMNIIGAATPRLAVILSKFDAMHELRNVEDVDWQSIMSNSGAAFLRDPSLESAEYQQDDGELLHEEVRSLLHKLNAGRLVLSLENPHSGKAIPYRFFAVSALGEAPRGESVHPRGIAPFRCLDPAKWVLSMAGAI
jgi:hypothetical protein